MIGEVPIHGEMSETVISIPIIDYSTPYRALIGGSRSQSGEFIDVAYSRTLPFHPPATSKKIAVVPVIQMSVQFSPTQKVAARAYQIFSFGELRLAFKLDNIQRFPITGGRGTDWNARIVELK